MLDEIDKLGRDYRGDPAAALLEILDPGPERHVSRQLSRSAVRLVESLFHHRRRTRWTPSPARCSIGWKSCGFRDTATEEKIEIARRYLIPRQWSQNGVEARTTHLAGRDGAS